MGWGWVDRTGVEGALVDELDLERGNRVGSGVRESCLEKGAKEVSNRWVRGWSMGMLKGNG